MESLTRHNYEIWFLDYLDGQLSNEQLETLLDFLEQNPDLKQELSGVSSISLAAGTETIDRKELLLKTTADIPGMASVDQLCIARMENDLPVEEARNFDNRLENEPDLSKRYAAFRLTRLNPAAKIIYPFKKDLLKKTVLFTPWMITALSAAAIILLAWILWPHASETATPGMAKIEKPATVNPQPAISTPSAKPSALIASNLPVPASKRNSARKENPEPAKPESLQRETVPMNSLARKTVVAGPRIPDPIHTKVLYASNYPAVRSISSPDEKTLTVPQYALRMFREKVLGENRTVVDKTNFSMWEVAGAGVSKINDIAGTKMKLNREYDSKGDILAVSFNSRLFDVETPVKGQPNR